MPEAKVLGSNPRMDPVGSTISVIKGKIKSKLSFESQHFKFIHYTPPPEDKIAMYKNSHLKCTNFFMYNHKKVVSRNNHSM